MKNTSKRAAVEQYVNNHPTLSKVVSFNSNAYGLEKKSIEEKLILFLLKETVCIANNILYGVRSFEFDSKTQNFINRTKSSSWF